MEVFLGIAGVVLAGYLFLGFLFALIAESVERSAHYSDDYIYPTFDIHIKRVFTFFVKMLKTGDLTDRLILRNRKVYAENEEKKFRELFPIKTTFSPLPDLTAYEMVKLNSSSIKVAWGNFVLKQDTICWFSAEEWDNLGDLQRHFTAAEV